MNLLNLGDSLTYIFAMLSQVDLYEFAFTSKRARRLVITYIKRADACEYVNSSHNSSRRECVGNGHILCTLIDKRATSGCALYALFGVGHGLDDNSDIVRGAKLIFDKFRDKTNQMVCDSMTEVVNATLGNDNPIFWNMIDFTPQLIEKVRDVLREHEYWSTKHGKHKILDLFRCWTALKKHGYF